jgi:hypothetical protein
VDKRSRPWGRVSGRSTRPAETDRQLAVRRPWAAPTPLEPAGCGDEHGRMGLGPCSLDNVTGEQRPAVIQVNHGGGLPWSWCRRRGAGADLRGRGCWYGWRRPHTAPGARRSASRCRCWWRVPLHPPHEPHPTSGLWRMPLGSGTHPTQRVVMWRMCRMSDVHPPHHDEAPELRVPPPVAHVSLVALEPGSAARRHGGRRGRSP